MNAWWKRTIAGLSALALLSGWPGASAWAGTPERPDVYVDGKRLYFDTQPHVFQNRTLVPMRMIFESLGAEVSWEGKTSTAVAVKDGVTLRLPIGSAKVMKNGQALELDVPAQLVNNRTMVPVRFIAEAFGNQVEWDGTRNRVLIKGGAGAPAVRVIGADYNGLEEGQTLEVQQMIREHDLVALVERETGLTFKKPVWVYLTNSDAGYKQALLTYGRAIDADLVHRVSEGVTYGNSVILPLHRNEETEHDVRMTLAHELVHVLLNQNGGGELPAWVHEGLAWEAGLDAAYAGRPELLRRAYDLWIRDYVLERVEEGSYRQLIEDPEETVSALDGAYNVELQDYLAYRYLLGQQGQAKFLDYLKSHFAGDQDAFAHVFGFSKQMFETQFKRYLDAELQKQSLGVAVTFRANGDYRQAGAVTALTQGASEELEGRQVMVEPGKTYTLRLFKDGRIEGIDNVPTDYVYEPEELYAYLMIDRATGESGGFTFHDSYGEYLLDYVWLDDLDGETHTPETIELLGLEILDLQPIR